MSTKTNDPKQTAPETEPVVDDIKTEPVTPDAEEKADKKTAQKEGKEKEPKASKEPKEPKERRPGRMPPNRLRPRQRISCCARLPNMTTSADAARVSARTSMPMSAARR